MLIFIFTELPVLCEPFLPVCAPAVFPSVVVLSSFARVPRPFEVNLRGSPEVRRGSRSPLWAAARLRVPSLQSLFGRKSPGQITRYSSAVKREAICCGVLCQERWEQTLNQNLCYLRRHSAHQKKEGCMFASYEFSIRTLNQKCSCHAGFLSGSFKKMRMFRKVPSKGLVPRVPLALTRRATIATPS